MPNMSQDYKNNATVFIAKNGNKGPGNENDLTAIMNNGSQYIDHNTQKNSIINNANVPNLQKACIYFLLDMIMEGLSDDFIYNTIFNDSYIQPLTLDALNSMAFVMGEEFAMQFIGKQFTPDDITKAVTEKVLSENTGSSRQEEGQGSEEQQAMLNELNKEIADAKNKISENEKTIQALQSEHSNQIGLFNQQIESTKNLYKELMDMQDKFNTELSAEVQRAHTAEINAANEKSEGELKTLRKELELKEESFKKDCDNYENQIKAKDKEIEDLHAQLDKCNKTLAGLNINSIPSDRSPEEQDCNSQDIASSQAKISLIDRIGLPKGRPDRKFSKREADKRSTILSDAINNRSEEQMEQIADAYARGLPSGALMQMYKCENAPAANLRLLECALLRENYGLD